MLNFWSRVADELDCYCKAFLALVVDHKKGSPGTKGSLFLVTEGGGRFGTIGGGAMEMRLSEEAEAALGKGRHKPTLQTVVHRSTRDESASGLICGGSQSQVTLVLDQSHRRLIHAVLDRVSRDKPGCLVISPEGLHLDEENMDRPSIELAGEGREWTVRFGLLNRHRIVIAGCGHCGAALARQMDFLGFQVTVVEPRADLFTLKDLPSTVNQRIENYDVAAEQVEHAELTFAVVMTPSYTEDIAALASLLPRPFRFIGIMGSPSKVKKIREALATRGFGDEDVGRLQAPVGLPMLSDTPEQIAVSVAAQILRVCQLDE